MAEFVIVGGGVYGAGVAYELAAQGAEVVLLEARGIGNGASAGPGKRGTRANGRDVRELPLIRLSHEMWPTLHERLGVQPFFERTGHLQLIERPQDIAAAEARALMQNAFGTETQVLDRAAVLDLEPGVSDTIIGALYCPADGVTDHTAATEAYAAAARRAGADVRTHARVARLEGAADQVTAVVTTEGERIEIGRQLYLLANAGVPDLIGDRLRLPIWSRTFQVLITEPTGGPGIRQLIGHMSRTLAVKAEAGGRIMVSGGLPGVWDAATGRGTPLAASIAANLADAVAVFPQLDGAEVEMADADHLETVSVDGIPVIDQVPGAANAIYATAWCGHGWAIAPAVIEMLATWGLKGRKPDLLAPFTHQRFLLT